MAVAPQSPRSVPISVRLPEDLLAAADAAAAAQDRTRTSLITAALRAHLARYDTTQQQLLLDDEVA